MDTEYGRKTFNCAEQAMMFFKAKMFKDEAAVDLIMRSDSPKEQKAIGRLVKNFNADKWGNECLDIVTAIEIAKFSSDPVLTKILLETDDKEIVEASPYDIIWGVGLAEDDPRILFKKSWKGKNYLGICLMNAREHLKEQQNVT